MDYFKVIHQASSWSFQGPIFNLTPYVIAIESSLDWGSSNTPESEKAFNGVYQSDRITIQGWHSTDSWIDSAAVESLMAYKSVDTRISRLNYLYYFASIFILMEYGDYCSTLQSTAKMKSCNYIFKRYTNAQESTYINSSVLNNNNKMSSNISLMIKFLNYPAYLTIPTINDCLRSSTWCAMRSIWTPICIAIWIPHVQIEHT